MPLNEMPHNWVPGNWVRLDEIPQQERDI